jgi:hypothetical protein
MRKLLLALALTLVASGAFAQALVRQDQSRSDAASFLQGMANGATSCNTASQTATQDTITITPPAGLFVYITGVYFDIIPVDATGVTQLGYVSSTNLTGSPIWSQGTVAASLAGRSISETYPTALKSTVAGTAVTFVPSATQNAKVILCGRVAGYFAP